MNEKERIEKVMQTQGMNSAVFASEIGIQGSTLSHILNGRNKPSLAVLQSILNRFPDVSPEWLIMGQGTTNRSVKQSQTLTLFDNLDESASKSVDSDKNLNDESASASHSNQPKNLSVAEIPEKANQNETNYPPLNEKMPSATKSVIKIIVYYSDNTFQEFL